MIVGVGSIAFLMEALQPAARGGFTLPARRIEGLDRIDDMIGRAIEIGGAVLVGTVHVTTVGFFCSQKENDLTSFHA